MEEAGYDPSERGPAILGLWDGFLQESGIVYAEDPDHDDPWTRAWEYFRQDVLQP